MFVCELMSYLDLGDLNVISGNPALFQVVGTRKDDNPFSSYSTFFKLPRFLSKTLSN